MVKPLVDWIREPVSYIPDANVKYTHNPCPQNTLLESSSRFRLFRPETRSERSRELVDRFAVPLYLLRCA